MRVSLFLVMTFIFGTSFAKISDKELADCKKAALQLSPHRDPKDIEILCRDPYLKGSPKESKEDKARRAKLIKESDAAKESALDKLTGKSSDKNGSASDCKKALLEADPGRDPQDADMLCRNPYLRGQAGESYEDQVRRKRLIKESEDAKNKALDKYVTPSSGKPASGSGSGVN